MRYGYIRVSRANADGSTTLENQRRQLAAADVDQLFEDVVSGLAASRPGLDELLDVVQAGDDVVVVALDRLGRDFMHSVGLLQTFADRGVDLQVLNLPADVTDVAGGGRLIAVIALELAAIEREKIAERTRAGLDRARAEGKLTGRRWSVSRGQMLHVHELRADGLTHAEIARKLAISEDVVGRVLKVDAPGALPDTAFKRGMA